MKLVQPQNHVGFMWAGKIMKEQYKSTLIKLAIFKDCTNAQVYVWVWVERHDPIPVLDLLLENCAKQRQTTPLPTELILV